MKDYKSPKLIKLYYKPSTDTSPERAYLRNISGSKLAGMFICHNDEQVNNIKGDNLLVLYSSMMADRTRMLNRYRNKATTFIGYGSSYISSMGSDYAITSNSGNIDKLYTHLLDRVVNEEDDYDIIQDVLVNYFHNIHIDIIVPNLVNANVHTEDGMHTKMWKVAGSDSYHNGNSIEGDPLSLIAYSYARHCNDCNYIDYDEDTDCMHWVAGGDYSVCESCRDDSYSYCEDCGDLFHHDDMHYSEREGTYYCDTHYNHVDDSVIHEYNYTPYLTFYDYNKNVMSRVENYRKHTLPFYGAELEVECKGGDRNEYAENIMNYEGEEKYFYCKQDGSLSHGFEICFMPMTFNAIKSLNLWDAMLKYRGSDKLQSYNTSTCGMHIHINREAFTDHHLFKFISFIHEYKSFNYLISQRKKARELNQYSKFNNAFKDRAKKSMVETIKNRKSDYRNSGEKYSTHSTTRFGDKYVPINLQHTNTVEVRIFKGNLMEESIRKNFEFVDSLYYFTKANPIYRLKVQEYLDFCSRDIKMYPNLNKFVDSNIRKVKDILTFPLAVPEGLEY